MLKIRHHLTILMILETLLLGFLIFNPSTPPAEAADCPPAPAAPSKRKQKTTVSKGLKGPKVSSSDSVQKPRSARKGCGPGPGETPEDRRKRLIAERNAIAEKYKAAMEKWNRIAKVYDTCTSDSIPLPGRGSTRITGDGTQETCGQLPTQPTEPNLPRIPGLPIYRLEAIVPPQTYAYAAAVQLTLPTPTINIGPDPSIMKENMAVVGYPYWLWTSPAPSLDVTKSSGPLSVSLRAEQISSTFKIDSQTVSCPNGGTPYVRSSASTASPDCGIEFTTRGKKRIVATTEWRIYWTAAGQSGSFNMRRMAIRDLRVGELQALNKRPR